MTYEEILAAAERLAPVARQTPVMTSRTLDRVCGSTLFLKCENFQRTGAFKFRGAYNALAQLSAPRGVLTYSSGNHAQAVACSGALLGIPTLVVMPFDAAEVKVRATREYGAEIVKTEPEGEPREAVAARIMEERELTLIPPFNHPQVIAGQGTAALELIREVEDLEVILTPCGGGGLLSGTAIAAKHLMPGVRVIGVEPAGAAKAARSLKSGKIEVMENPVTRADGLKPRALGDLTFGVIRSLVDDILTVSEEEIRAAVAFLWTRMKLIVEPSGAVSLAPLLAGRLGISAGKRVGVILSGGNADIPAVAAWLAEGESWKGGSPAT